MFDELESWFSDRPLWLQDATVRLLNDNLNEDGYNDLKRICCNEVELQIDDEVVPTAQQVTAEVLGIEPTAQNVKLCSISNLIGLNALSPRNPLILEDGLNIIYGDNGSGKSGYTRLLKHVCDARNKEDLYADVFSETPPSQSCTVCYKENDEESTLAWCSTEGVVSNLSSVEIYDSCCASVYVTDENKLAYVPSILNLFTQLCTVSETLSTKLDEIKNSYVSTKPILPTEFKFTALGIWYTSLNADVLDAVVTQNTSWTEADVAHLSSLNLRLSTEDPAIEARKIRVRVVELKKLVKTFRELELKLSEGSCSSYLAAKKEYNLKKNASVEYAESIFENSPLEGIGEESWKLLWKQAKLYSENKAYVGKTFPNTEDEAVCVLCQQSLNGESKGRLNDFEEFISGELEVEAQSSKKQYELLRDKLKEEFTAELISSQSTGAELDDIISSSLLVLLAEVSSTISELLEYDGEESFVSTVSFDVINELDALIISREVDASQFEEDARAADREGLESNKKELDARKWMFQQRTSILDEVILQTKIKKINEAKKLTNTRKMTNKISEIADSIVSPSYMERFESEVATLGAGRIKVKLEKTRSSKGTVFFQIKLDDNIHSAPVEGVLSEGEFRIISLASFLADVEGQEGNSTFIFDDPISSLDQSYEERVAERLVEMSRDRQVIVFTHRTSLLVTLQSIADAKSLPNTTIGLTKEEWGAGEVGNTPVLVQKPKASINNLINKIPEGRRILEEQGSEFYDWWAKSICSTIRITIEKLIEYDLLADVVQRFRRPIKTAGKLSNVAKVTDADCQYIDSLMTQFSCYEHSQPAESPVPLPSPDELTEDLTRLKDWLAEFSARR